MRTELVLLRALHRLARRQTAASFDSLVAHVREGASEVESGLIMLAKRGLVQRFGAQIRLTLEGLAVVVAHAAQTREASRRAKTLTSSARAGKVIHLEPLHDERDVATAPPRPVVFASA
jgi:ABC-type enterochelin transport system substrate-binding protein